MENNVREASTVSGYEQKKTSLISAMNTDLSFWDYLWVRSYINPSPYWEKNVNFFKLSEGWSEMEGVDPFVQMTFYFAIVFISLMGWRKRRV